MRWMLRRMGDKLGHRTVRGGMMGQLFTARRHSDGALVLSAIVQDGKACGAYRRERTYHGYTVAEAKRQFRAEMKSNGAIFDGEGG